MALRSMVLGLGVLLSGHGEVWAQPASPIPNDPFQSVPAPAVRPRPVAPPPQPSRPAPAPSGFPVPVGQSFRDCADCPEMVVIPAGRFTMGSPPSETGRDSHEGPQREVVVSRALAVGKFEVTFAEWDACVAAGGCGHRPSDHGWGRGRQPVMNVSWDDAQGYVRWLSSRTGRGYRLLTEAEWEYAARAGTTTRFTFGDNESHICRFGNGADQTARLSNPGRPVAPCDDGYVNTAPVGSFAANRFGLHDMHGNVWEWVQDCYVAQYAGASADASQALESGGCSARVVRGGSWASSPRLLRAADRSRNSAGSRGDFIGFRVARTPG
ncbi:Formylglycine-generating enzyme, required for sulfatase activity, contains SUMF1/FGE domain [Falsiroseomonas stagni DSM 19981]|uniref:Formylglycine-generating enzyme, required for sulfatase activity, contains SUMF1/FGE domain n=2 Tax=Falsiroseomonas TaxID=2870713 RepID=A0A1I4FDQ3_9PROT|nr:Formylglycine-generating enzyme, required for sulfatase activity, contains SUMF1/FGE domain [Falsiroseomonas stagni DSM 19981]